MNTISSVSRRRNPLMNARKGVRRRKRRRYEDKTTLDRGGVADGGGGVGRGK